MTPPQLAGLIGFLFVAAWAALDFGDAVLCLIGAAVFYVAVAIYQGELDVGALQQRVQNRPRR